MENDILYQILEKVNDIQTDIAVINTEHKELIKDHVAITSDHKELKKDHFRLKENFIKYKSTFILISTFIGTVIGGISSYIYGYFTKK